MLSYEQIKGLLQAENNRTNEHASSINKCKHQSCGSLFKIQTSASLSHFLFTYFSLLSAVGDYVIKKKKKKKNKHRFWSVLYSTTR